MKYNNAYSRWGVGRGVGVLLLRTTTERIPEQETRKRRGRGGERKDGTE